MNDRNPRMLTYAMAIAELITSSEGQKENLLYEKFEALRKSWSFTELYARDGFDEKILDVIMEKKSRMILDAKTIKDRPVLFDIKVLPKTMTDGYGSWWRVGDTEVSQRQENLDAYADHLAHVKDARKY